MKRILLFAIGLFACITTIQAVKVKTIKAEYTYYAPTTISMEQAKQTALERARLQGIANEFGMNMNQLGQSMVENIDGESRASAFQLTNSSVKGEWIRDLEDPKFKIAFEDNMFIVTVEVRFEAREVSAATIDYTAKILRHSTDDRFESDEFLNGDDFYLSFQTPKDGYLAVYLVADDMAFCLLPYRDQTDGIIKVKANKRYVFFSREEDKNPVVDEYVMTTDKQVENDVVYILFSPNEFTKATDKQSDRQSSLEGTAGLPRELPFDKYQKWLSKMMGRDEKLGVNSIPITIKR